MPPIIRYNQEINLLIAALEQKVPQELLQPNVLISMDMQLDRFAQRLHDVTGIKEAFAYWGGGILGIGLGCHTAAHV